MFDVEAEKHISFHLNIGCSNWMCLFFFNIWYCIGFWQICRALAYIHGTIGVCHRDIKPQNLLVCWKIFYFASVSFPRRNGFVLRNWFSNFYRWTHTPTSLNYVTLVVQKFWSRGNQTYRTSAPDTIGLQSSYLVLLSIPQRLTFGLLDVFLLSLC